MGVATPSAITNNNSQNPKSYSSHTRQHESRLNASFMPGTEGSFSPETVIINNRLPGLGGHDSRERQRRPKSNAGLTAKLGRSFSPDTIIINNRLTVPGSDGSHTRQHKSKSNAGLTPRLPTTQTAATSPQRLVQAAHTPGLKPDSSSTGSGDRSRLKRRHEGLDAEAAKHRCTQKLKSHYTLSEDLSGDAEKRKKLANLVQRRQFVVAQEAGHKRVRPLPTPNGRAQAPFAYPHRHEKSSTPSDNGLGAKDSLASLEKTFEAIKAHKEATAAAEKGLQSQFRHDSGLCYICDQYGYHFDPSFNSFPAVRHGDLQSHVIPRRMEGNERGPSIPVGRRLEAEYKLRSLRQRWTRL